MFFYGHSFPTNNEWFTTLFVSIEILSYNNMNEELKRNFFFKFFVDSN